MIVYLFCCPICATGRKKFCMHEQRWFKGIGMLDWLDPKEFYSGNWVLSEKLVKDQFGLAFSIVRNKSEFDLRYTTL